MLAKQRRQRAASHRACCSVNPSSTSLRPVRRSVASTGTGSRSTRSYVSSRRWNWESSTSCPSTSGGSSPVNVRWMSAATMRPSAMASMRVRGPLAASPPDQTSSRDVFRVDSSNPIVRRGEISGPESPRASRSIAWPIARITVSASYDRRSSGSNLGAKRPSSLNTDRTPMVSSPVTFPSSVRILAGPRLWMNVMSSAAASSSSNGEAGISSSDSRENTVTSVAPSLAADLATSSASTIISGSRSARSVARASA